MAVGKHTLKNIDFSNPQTPVAVLPSVERTKGRSRDFLAARDKQLIIRYYYYNAIKKCVYDKTIVMLSYELHIAPKTIARVLKREEDTIIKMKKEKPSVEGFKKELFWLHW